MTAVRELMKYYARKVAGDNGHRSAIAAINYVYCCSHIKAKAFSRMLSALYSSPVAYTGLESDPALTICACISWN